MPASRQEPALQVLACDRQWPLSFGPRTHGADTIDGGDSLEHSHGITLHIAFLVTIVGVGSGGRNE